MPQSLWPAVKSHLEADLASMKMGSPEDMSNFITAVISEASFDKLARYIDQAKNDSDAEVIMGGNYDKSKGYFIEPTILGYVLYVAILFPIVFQISLKTPVEPVK
uniref:aldehyde dehydrogenase family protein n=1 Tax=Flavobacterium sp. TaxID=239 RepID=UPI0040473CCE